MATRAPFFPLFHGVPPVDDRRVIRGILSVIRDGFRWNDAPKFDRSADARVLTCLTSGDDATHDAVAMEVARAIAGMTVARVRDRLALNRGLPKISRSDHGKAFCSNAMVAWADAHGLT